MFDKPAPTAPIRDLVVYALGVYPVEISDKRRLASNKRVPLKASVDPQTGEVTFYVDPDQIHKLRR